jgi:hypothetical protein
MFLLSPERIDRAVYSSGNRALAGLTLLAIAALLPQEWRCGVICAIVLLSQAIYYLWLRRWRTDPGLWMAATLLVVMLGPSFLYFEFEYWQSVFMPPPARQPQPKLTWGEIGFAIDAVVALKLFGGIVRVAASVAVENWKFTRALAKSRRTAAATDGEKGLE